MAVFHRFDLIRHKRMIVSEKTAHADEIRTKVGYLVEVRFHHHNRLEYHHQRAHGNIAGTQVA